LALGNLAKLVFGQFYRSRIEVLIIAQLLSLVISSREGKSERIERKLKHKIRILVLFGLLYIFVGLIVNGRYLCTFWQANYTSSRTGSRKLWRALDTCASIFTLGSFFNYVDQILIIIDHLPYLTKGLLKLLWMVYSGEKL
jgi:hypothetical protein